MAPKAKPKAAPPASANSTAPKKDVQPPLSTRMSRLLPDAEHFTVVAQCPTQGLIAAAVGSQIVLVRTMGTLSAPPPPPTSGSPKQRNQAASSQNDSSILPEQHTAPVTVLSFSEDGAFLASGGKDNRVVLWFVSRKGEVTVSDQALTGHGQPISRVVFSPKGDLVASTAGSDRLVKVSSILTPSIGQAESSRSATSTVIKTDSAILDIRFSDTKENEILVLCVSELVTFDVVSGQRLSSRLQGMKQVGSLPYRVSTTPFVVCSNPTEANTVKVVHRLTGSITQVFRCSTEIPVIQGTETSGGDGGGGVPPAATPVMKSYYFSEVAMRFSPDDALLAVLWEPRLAAGKALSDEVEQLPRILEVYSVSDGSRLLRRFVRPTSTTSFLNPNFVPELEGMTGLLFTDEIRSPPPGASASSTITLAQPVSTVKLQPATPAAKEEDVVYPATVPAGLLLASMEASAGGSAAVPPPKKKPESKAPQVPPHPIDSLFTALIEKIRALEGIGNVKTVTNGTGKAGKGPAPKPSPAAPTSEAELQARDLRRPELLQDLTAISTAIAALPKNGAPVKRLLARVEELQPMVEVHAKLIAQFPLPASAGGPAGQALWPYQQARDAIKTFKKQMVVPILTARLTQRQRREQIQEKAKLGIDVEPEELAELNTLDDKVQRLFAEFKPAYDSFTALLRPGFPELSHVIWEELDRHCGMGKLRMDLTLADFSYTSLPTAPDVLKATTHPASQKAKGLKANYILKKFSSNEDFYREMEAMRVAQSNGVHHPNVAEVEFAFEEGYGATAVYYLAMPWYLCDSKTWFKRQLEAKNGSAVLRALLEMADGLSCLHHNGVIHGDLKPDNLMFDVDQPTGRPKWIDFDFAGVDPKTLAVLKLKTAAVGISLGFAPPEFFDGSTKNRTRESDVYSLGCTFAALLGMPDPTTADAAGAGKGKSTTGKLAQEVLGTATYDSLTELCRLMTHQAPEKRLSLSQSTQLGGRPVLERLGELYSQLTDE
jgi:hypothetical protein